MTDARTILTALALAGLTVGCQDRDAGRAEAAQPGPRAPEPASQAFWDRWSDGQAELSGYRMVTPRYGELREGTTVLIYVTEEMNKTTLIKDDTGQVPADSKEVVMKLNHTLKFRTGIYPYSVMTSVFSPVGSAGRERFAPVKISFTAQEWCGHVFQMITPTLDGFRSDIHSYFSTEGDAITTTETEPLTLYEDALFIQLRELDGPFEGGGNWSGYVVPSLWGSRRQHASLAPVPATITRSSAERDGTPVTRFVLAYGDFTRTMEVETAPEHRILGWTTSEGEEASLLRTVRLPYWRLNGNDDAGYLKELGF